MSSKVVRAISVKIGDEIELISGPNTGYRTRVIRKKPVSAMYATHVMIECNRRMYHYHGKWVPVRMWRKVT